MQLSDLPVGCRVEIVPYICIRQIKVRQGVITKRGRKYVTVKFDRTGQTIQFLPVYIARIL